MLNVKALYNLLPSGFKNKKEILVYDQDTDDIIKGMVKQFNKFKFDYDYISPEFYTGHLKRDLYNLWSFCRTNLNYVIESQDGQALQSPASILYGSMNGGSVDCKCLSLFVAGVIDSWLRLGLYDHKIKSLKFVFASYDSNPQPQHVFVECNNYWIDAVLPDFDCNKNTPTFTKNKNLMLYSIAGFNERHINRNIYRDVFGGGNIVGEIDYIPEEQISAEVPTESTSVPVPSSSVPVPNGGGQTPHGGGGSPSGGGGSAPHGGGGAPSGGGGTQLPQQTGTGTSAQTKIFGLPPLVVIGGGFLLISLLMQDDK